MKLQGDKNKKHPPEESAKGVDDQCLYQIENGEKNDGCNIVNGTVKSDKFDFYQFGNGCNDG